MNKTMLYTLAILLLASNSYAQSSWIWGRGNTGGDMESWAVATDPYGHEYVAGTSYATTVYFGADSIYDPLATFGNAILTLVKYDENGNLMWAKGVNDNNSFPVNITTDSWGNVLLLGIFTNHIMIDTFNLYSNVMDSFQYFIVKLDTAGNVLWATTSGEFTNYSPYFTSTSDDGDFLSWGGITTDLSGNVYVTGNFNSSSMVMGTDTLLNHDPSDTTNDVFVAMYNSSGSQVWATCFGGNNNDNVLSITVASTGNVFISGITSSPQIITGSDTLKNTIDVQIAFIAELSPTGTLLWGEDAGGVNGAFAAGLQSDHSGNVFMVGGFGDAYIVFGTDTIYRTYPAGVPYMETYLVKFNDTNHVIWHKTIGSPSCSIFGYSIAQGNAEDGAIWISSAWSNSNSFSFFINDSANIDGQKLYTPDSSTDPVLIAGYDWSGTVIGYAALQSGSDDQTGIACDASNNVYLCADYAVGSGYTYFHAGNDSFFAVVDYGVGELQYIAKYGFNPAKVIPIENDGNRMAIYPNPANNELCINSSNIISSVSIYDLPGREMYKNTYHSAFIRLNIDYLNPGIYFIRINGDVVRKFIKE